MDAQPHAHTLSHARPGRTPLLTPARWVQLGVIVVLFWLVYGDTIRSLLVNRWINDGNWSHGWLIPLFSIYFLTTRRDQLLRLTPRPSYWGVVVLGGSLALFIISGWWLRMGYPRALSMVGSIFGLTLLLGGWNILKHTWFAVAFLLLAIPLPDALYREITMPLRELASTGSAAILPLLVPGLHTEAQAVVIDYVVPGRPPGVLNVEEACSGMRSTMAFVTLGVAIAYLGDRPAWQRLVMVLACVPIALVCNVIRVTITGWLHVTGHEELARGTAHQLLGMAMFVVALGLFALLGYVLDHLFVEVPEEEPAGA